MYEYDLACLKELPPLNEVIVLCRNVLQIGEGIHVPVKFDTKHYP